METPRDPEEIYNAPVSPARNSDPGTAHAAARANKQARGSQRALVYEFLKQCGPIVGNGAEFHGGATDYEAGRALGILRTSAGKRRKELQELGLVIDSGKRRTTDTQSTAIVWMIKPDETQYAERLRNAIQVSFEVLEVLML